MTEDYRLRELERRVTKLEDEGMPADIRELRVMVKAVAADVVELRDDVIWMKRALISAIFTLLGGMILFLITISAGWLH